MVYAVATLVVFGGAMAWSRYETSEDPLAGLVYVPPAAMAWVGIATVVASVVTVFWVKTVRGAKIGQLVSSVPHLVPVLVYGYFAVLLVLAGGFLAVEDGSAALTVGFVFGTLAHLGWFVHSVREARRSDRSGDVIRS
ncbi:hypothetical protein [Aeromicrobium duanguangcaii]|uniref:hypothetical protein n=1 Tax=Aeromicrobium duanguangcaii TaxID=2968086 RepID=UPI0020180692|nr:hypothetical protein [Aeromicrobium duanguangcaii]MCL3838373.1 hypothetical protein [Aeromicrobium duanguangcaii]